MSKSGVWKDSVHISEKQLDFLFVLACFGAKKIDIFQQANRRLCILASWFLSPVSKNSVLEKLRVRRLAFAHLAKFILTFDLVPSVTLCGGVV